VWLVRQRNRRFSEHRPAPVNSSTTAANTTKHPNRAGKGAREWPRRQARYVHLDGLLWPGSYGAMGPRNVCPPGGQQHSDVPPAARACEGERVRARPNLYFRLFSPPAGLPEPSKQHRSRGIRLSRPEFRAPSYLFFGAPFPDRLPALIFRSPSSSSLRPHQSSP
jgi:hypothetical protein